MLEAILLDMDGVIVDSEEMYCRAVQETFRPLGVNISKEEYIRRWMIDPTCSQGVIEDYGLDITLEEVRVSVGQNPQKGYSERNNAFKQNFKRNKKANKILESDMGNITNILESQINTNNPYQLNNNKMNLIV